MTKKWNFAWVAILLAANVCGFTQDEMGRYSAPSLKVQAQRDVKVTYGPAVQSLTDTTAFITWSTNVSANTVLRYGTSSGNLNQVAQSPSGGTTHHAKLKDLIPDTTYFYRVGTSAPQATEPMSAPASFKTKPAKATH